MSFHLKPSDRSVEAGIRRIAVSQIDSVLAEIGDAELGLSETVHQVRKRCKKVRGLVRLVRPCFGDYRRENAMFRDAAARLSGVRDADALLETYDGLMDVFGDQVDRRAFASIRRALTEQKKAAVRRDDLDGELGVVRAEMVAARDRVADWSLDDDGFGAVAGGLRKTYGRARSAMAAARRDPSAEALHEWRKRMKYHWYHVRLLRGIWSGPMKARAAAADEVTDILGNHHDLEVFLAALREAPATFGSSADVEAVAGLAERHQAVLAADARALGKRLLAEKPKALGKRWRRYWKAWKDQKPLEVRALAA